MGVDCAELGARLQLPSVENPAANCLDVYGVLDLRWGLFLSQARFMFLGTCRSSLTTLSC